MKKNKKIIGIFLSILLVFCIGTSTVKAEEYNEYISTFYQISPTSESWKSFSSEELKKMLNIPMTEAQNMDTATLLTVVLEYPFLGDIYAFEDPIKALDFLGEQFLPLKVLLTRKDAGEKLVQNYYEETSEILRKQKTVTFEDRFKHKYRESLLTYPSINVQLSNRDKAEIVSKSRSVAVVIDSYGIDSEQEFLLGKSSVQLKNLEVIKEGTVLTPKYSQVSVFELREMSQADKNANDAYMASRYPNATKLRSASYKYNCHSYAWYSTSSSNSWWMNYPTKYMTDGSYKKTTSPSRNQKVYYPNPGNEHSGIITSVSGSKIKVTSKWGAFGLYEHNEMDCPYFSMYLNTYWTPNI